MTAKTNKVYCKKCHRRVTNGRVERCVVENCTQKSNQLQLLPAPKKEDTYELKVGEVLSGQMLAR